MEFKLDRPDMVLMDGRTLAAFEYGTALPVVDHVMQEGGYMDEGRMLARLRANPALAAELLSYDGTIVYMGRSAKDINGEGNTLGMHFTKGGTSVEGDNVYGRFLMRVRSSLRDELKNARIDEVLVRPGQIVKDYVPAGAEQSYIEMQEGRVSSSGVDGRRYELVPGQDVSAFGRFLSDNGLSDSVRLRHEDGADVIEFHGLEGADLAAVMDIVRGSYAFTQREVVGEGGRKYIHTEPYRPLKFRFDAAMNGTTGHAGRQSGSDVAFQTFECPFGTDYRSKVRVGSAAEASLLYEKALRRELDWKSLFADLRSRSLVKNLSASDEGRLVQDLRAQFDWMRERICRDRSLADAAVVCDSLLVPDASFGRSIYDADSAPSPAHILSRYVNNPLLLFSGSENGVLRALESSDKNEALRFTAVSGGGRVTIVVDGSDTIGGRVPNTRAVKQRTPVYRKDERGRIVKDQWGKPVVESVRDVHKLELKPQAEIDADYSVFSRRLDDILSNIAPEVHVELVTGSGIGVPQMVHRYVQEKGGRVFDYDYASGRMHEEKGKAEGDVRFSQVRMPHFADVMPVLVGRADSVSFCLREGDDDSLVRFDVRNGFGARFAGLSDRGFIEFSSSSDRRNRTLLDNGSLAVSSGVPTVHVQDNLLEEEQVLRLATESTVVRDRFVGERRFSDSLFDGEQRVVWDTGRAEVMSYVEQDGSLAIPEVGFCLDAAVYVSSVPFHSVYGAYVALLAKESGITDPEYYRNVDENSMEAMASLAGALDATPEVQERCMRNAVHMMVQASSRFADRLLSLPDGDVVCPSTYGGDVLFTDLEGKGGNRFGVVLMAERDALRVEMENVRRREQEEAQRLSEENARMVRRAASVRARGEKMSGGLPADVSGTEGAVWLLGTARPSRLAFDGSESSFYHWEETEYGKDSLNRELASRRRLDDGEGGTVENNLVFLFASDELACTGRRHVMNNPDAKDLTGVKRVNPATGEEFTCAFGIPVKRDNMYYEMENRLGRACSFRLDRDSSAFYHSILAADAMARTTAIRQGMSLCYAKRERNNADGSENDDLSRVFNAKVWDYPRTQEVIDRNTGRTVSEGGAVMPREVKRRVYNREEHRYEYESRQVVRKEWVDNPHAAPMLKSMVKRYEKMLVNGSDYPLSCICMAESVYPEIVPEDGVHTVEQRREMAENRFLSDFTFALDMSSAAALSLDVPMRFPLDAAGRLDLGPGVPERFRDMAERKLDAFINVVRDEGIINDEIPRITRISIGDTVSKGVNLASKGDGSEIYMRPNDLLSAFGPYDFRDVNAGMVVPLHEMAFRTEDGTVFRVVHNKLTRGMQAGEINRYLRYEKNEECRFTVRSSDPDRIPQFVTALKSYVERAKRIKVETRLLSEQEAAGNDMPLEGYVHLLSSNSDRMAVDGEISARGDLTGVELPNRFDGTDGETPYYGREDAKDGFAGYAQFRYTLPDGTVSDWVTVTDREVATDLVYSKVQRVYRSDVRVVPTPLVMEAELRALAVSHAGEWFRRLTQEVRSVETDTKVVESERYVSAAGEDSDEVQAAQVVEKEERETGRVFVTYYGSRSVPEDAVKVQISTSCPAGMKGDMDFEFELLYPDYKTMVGPHKEGRIDDAEYTRRYGEQVLDAKKDRILAGMKTVIDTAKEEGKDVYLYCYCKPGAFCHRYLVNNFLNENGIACQENPADRKLYRQGHVQLFGEEPQAAAKVQEEAAEQQVFDDGESVVTYSRSFGAYQKRTWENAQADDVDFTLQFAVDFSTYGEKATANAAGDSLISVPLPVGESGLKMTSEAVGEMVQTVLNALPEDFVKGEEFGVNIAGNGLYTLARRGVDQESLDVLLVAVMTGLKEKGVNIRSVRSGGQTGVDESAAVIGQVLGVPTVIHGTYDFAFRGADGKDVRNNEEAYMRRFESKDPGVVKEKAAKLLSRRVGKRSSQGMGPAI